MYPAPTPVCLLNRIGGSPPPCWKWGSLYELPHCHSGPRRRLLALGAKLGALQRVQAEATGPPANWYLWSFPLPGKAEINPMKIKGWYCYRDSVTFSAALPPSSSHKQGRKEAGKTQAQAAGVFFTNVPYACCSPRGSIISTRHYSSE